ncbi:MAG: hypothetical protein IKA68_01135 [Clostridia bacterium]|nr:hypothetical protein [Clostridia bacterium]
MKIFLLCPRSFGANTYLLVSGKHAIAVDPCVTVGAISKALDEAEARLEGNFSPTGTLTTPYRWTSSGRPSPYR